MFLSYDDYLSCGGTISDEMEFNRCNYRAETLINRLTFGRIKQENPVRDCVKYLTYELIGLIQAGTANPAISAGVSSVSNDGVTVSYADGDKVAGSFDAQAQALALMYLADQVDDTGTCLLYAGRME